MRAYNLRVWCACMCACMRVRTGYKCVCACACMYVRLYVCAPVCMCGVAGGIGCVRVRSGT